MKVQICTPEKQLLLEDITYIRLPATSGEMGVLDNHAPMIVSLTKGEIVFHPKGRLKISGGTAFIQPKETLIMTDEEITHDV